MMGMIQQQMHLQQQQSQMQRGDGGNLIQMLPQRVTTDGATGAPSGSVVAQAAPNQLMLPRTQPTLAIGFPGHDVGDHQAIQSGANDAAAKPLSQMSPAEQSQAFFASLKGKAGDQNDPKDDHDDDDTIKNGQGLKARLKLLQKARLQPKLYPRARP